MSFDITHLLAQWDYQPGQVMVRKFMGKDGLEKIQLRVDLGLLQMNAQGRPDGKRPKGFASLYELFQHRHEQQRHQSTAEGALFVLSAEECAKLQLELLQYHHRYICLLQLEEFNQAVQDADRNMAVIDFVQEHAANDESAWALEQFRPQVLMLRTRAQACAWLHAKQHDEAIREIEAGLAALRAFYQKTGQTDTDETSAEILSLEAWLDDIKEQRPLSRREKLELDLKQAILLEDFEKAARVRDALRSLNPSDSAHAAPGSNSV